MPPRVYLAGPDVFFPDAVAWGERKRAICAAYGLAGIVPFDLLAQEPAEWAALPEADRIARRCEAHIRGCAAVIANLTPFRSASADAGTVYEVGFARGLGRPVFGYSTTAQGFTERIQAGWGGPDPGWDRDGLTIEQFGLADNLMIDCAVREAGTLVIAEAGPDRLWTDLDGFTRCVQAAAASLAGRDAAEGSGDPGVVRQGA